MNPLVWLERRRRRQTPWKLALLLAAACLLLDGWSEVGVGSVSWCLVLFVLGNFALPCYSARAYAESEHKAGRREVLLASPVLQRHLGTSLFTAAVESLWRCPLWLLGLVPGGISASSPVWWVYLGDCLFVQVLLVGAGSIAGWWLGLSLDRVLAVLVVAISGYSLVGWTLVPLRREGIQGYPLWVFPVLATIVAGALYLPLQALLQGGLETPGDRPEMRQPGLARWIGAAIMRVFGPLGVTRSPFFILQRAQTKRWICHHPIAVVALSLASPLIPAALVYGTDVWWHDAFSFLVVPLCFVWWLAGVFASFDSLRSLLGLPTLEALSLTKFDAHRDTTGMIAGRFYLLAALSLLGLPFWIVDACWFGEKAILAIPFLLLLLSIAGTVGAVHSACINIENRLQGERRWLIRLEAPSCAILYTWPLLVGLPSVLCYSGTDTALPADIFLA
ncbi:MAG TPA: hypothetical protein VGO93_21240, partial [Candidatus Xenobia bacterium]